MELASTITLRTAAGEEILDLEEFEGRIERGEIEPFFEVCFPPLTGTRFVRAAELDAFQGLYEPRALYFQRAFHLGRIPVLTLLLSLINLGVFLLEGRSGPVDVEAMVALGAKAGPLLHDLGQLWRLVTANFVHRDWTHLGFNLFILFHFGGALENAYRPLDWIAVVVLSALGTTCLSYCMTDAVSAGASGVAYGMLGGAMVFGLKYRKILPDRYRAVLGGAVVPTVLIFLYLGFTSTGVDNWGHVGGLLAGAAATFPLRPRLLGELPSRRQRLLTRVMPLLLGGCLLAASEPLLEDRLPRFETVGDGSLGVELPIPSGWERDGSGGGLLAFSNGLAGPVRASLSLSARPSEGPVDLEEEARAFLSREIHPQLEVGRLRDISFQPLRYAHIGGLQGVAVDVSFAAEGARTLLTAHFFARGSLVYRLVLARPVGLPSYGRVFERILSGVRPIELQWAVAARERAQAHPADPEAWIALGVVEGRLGQYKHARLAFEAAQGLAPADPRPVAALARLAIAEGVHREGCRLSARARLLDPAHPSTLEALADCALAEGHRSLALERLEEAVAASHGDPRLRARLEAVRQGR